LIEILDSTTASSILPLSILLVKFLFFLGPDIGIQIYLPPGQRRKKNPSDLTFLFSGALHFIASNNDSGVREYDMERYQQYKHFRFDWPVNVSTFFFLFPIFGFFNFVYLHKRRILKINRNHGENMFLRLCLKSGEYRYMFLKQ